MSGNQYGLYRATFDSTGLAIQDLALALAVLEQVGELENVLELPL